jgi:hypothetical protein
MLWRTRVLIGAIGALCVGAYATVTETVSGAATGWERQAVGPVLVAGAIVILWLDARNRNWPSSATRLDDTNRPLE